MTRFATGFRNETVPRHRTGHSYIRSKFGLTQDTASMLEFTTPLWQADIGMCMPMAITEATWAQSAARGAAKLISPTFGYGVSRAEEFRWLPAGEQPKTLDDTGVDPNLTEDAYKIMGVVSWGLMPGPQDPRFDRRLITTLRDDEQPDVALAWQDAITAAYDKRSMVISEIDVSPSGRGDACCDLLNRHIMPVVTWYVDDPYMQNRGALVTRMDLGTPNHAQCVAQVDQDELRFPNWWRWDPEGYEWGLPDGSCRVSRKLFETLPQAQVRIFAITYLPQIL